MSIYKRPGGNCIITLDSYIVGPYDIIYAPGCVCALYNISTVMRKFFYLVIHEDGKTKILFCDLIRREHYRKVLERDGLINIINISRYRDMTEEFFIFSSPDGVEFVFNNKGERRILVEEVPVTTIGISGYYTIQNDNSLVSLQDCPDEGIVIDGYRNMNNGTCYSWIGNKIMSMTKIILKSVFELDDIRKIDDIFCRRYANTNEINYTCVLMILSGSTIHVRVWKESQIIESSEFEGGWSTAPFEVSDGICVVDEKGVMRDFRSAWVPYHSLNISSEGWGKITHLDMLHSDEPSLYEQNIKPSEGSLSIYHGMRVFNPRYKMVKSARKG